MSNQKKKSRRIAFLGIVMACVVTSLPQLVFADQFITIDFPGALGTDANGISSSGAIVGTYYDESTTHGFLMRQGVFSRIDVPGASSTTVNGVGATEATLVGSYTDAASRTHGFLYQGGAFATIDFPSSFSTYAFGVNDQQVVGYYDDALGSHGFFWQAGAFRAINFPGADSTFAFGINLPGDIVGGYYRME